MDKVLYHLCRHAVSIMDGWHPYPAWAIAKQAGVSISTARNRLRKLKQQGLTITFSEAPDPESEFSLPYHGWGEIDCLPTDSPDISFWREVYRLDCEIKGKKLNASMMNNSENIAKWHNKLHTDSAEYKMWGNGIALPNALYVMQGIALAMAEQWG